MNNFYNNSNRNNQRYTNNAKVSSLNCDNNILLSQNSIQSVLESSLGYFVRIEFLIGDSLLEVREGYLSDFGLDYLMIYNPEISGNILCDIYSVKFIYFSDYFAPQFVKRQDVQSISSLNEDKSAKQNINPQSNKFLNRNVRATNNVINNSMKNK